MQAISRPPYPQAGPGAMSIYNASHYNQQVDPAGNTKSQVQPQPPRPSEKSVQRTPSPPPPAPPSTSMPTPSLPPPQHAPQLQQQPPTITEAESKPQSNDNLSHEQFRTALQMVVSPLDP